MIRKLPALLSAIGILLLVFLHLYKLAEIPGIHYDEAWAMNYSWRVASEPGFWPWAAMSPYTAPWAHYWAALWLKLLGPSLLVFRGSQLALSLTGLLAMAWSLPRNARLVFPWAAMLLPGLVLNHRFAIELTGFHALAFGLLCLGLSRRWWFFAAFVALLGTTAHILFYAAILGLLFVAWHIGFVFDRKSRAAFFAYFAAIAFFFFQVLLAIPEKGKAGALLFSAIGAAVLLLVNAEKWRLWRFSWWGRALFALGAAFIFNALFFGQGAWTTSLYTGWSAWPNIRANLTSLSFGLLAFLFMFSLALRKALPFVRIWFLAGTFLLGLMMLKPAPRYFELALIGLATCFALASKAFYADYFQYRVKLSKQFHKRALDLGLVVLCFLLLNASSITFSTTLHGFSQGIQESDIRFLFFKDSSRDFLDKQQLVKFLGSSGCKLSDIETHDPRLLETLKALSLGDWQVNDEKRCHYIYVARRTEEGASGEPIGAFVLRRKR